MQGHINIEVNFTRLGKLGCNFNAARSNTPHRFIPLNKYVLLNPLNYTFNICHSFFTFDGGSMNVVYTSSHVSQIRNMMYTMNSQKQISEPRQERAQVH
jgi:hypothetical protein